MLRQGSSCSNLDSPKASLQPLVLVQSDCRAFTVERGQMHCVMQGASGEPTVNLIQWEQLAKWQRPSWYHRRTAWRVSRGKTNNNNKNPTHIQRGWSWEREHFNYLLIRLLAFWLAASMRDTLRMACVKRREKWHVSEDQLTMFSSHC